MGPITLKLQRVLYFRQRSRVNVRVAMKEKDSERLSGRATSEKKVDSRERERERETESGAEAWKERHISCPNLIKTVPWQRSIVTICTSFESTILHFFCWLVSP
jgi:hypothetical protein